MTSRRLRFFESSNHVPLGPAEILAAQLTKYVEMHLGRLNVEVCGTVFTADHQR
jgi:hypothetical protein